MPGHSYNKDGFPYVSDKTCAHIYLYFKRETEKGNEPTTYTADKALKESMSSIYNAVRWLKARGCLRVKYVPKNYKFRDNVSAPHYYPTYHNCDFCTDQIQYEES